MAFEPMTTGIVCTYMIFTQDKSGQIEEQELLALLKDIMERDGSVRRLEIVKRFYTTK